MNQSIQKKGGEREKEGILILPPVTGKLAGKQKNTVSTTAHNTHTVFAMYPITSGTLKARFAGR